MKRKPYFVTAILLISIVLAACSNSKNTVSSVPTSTKVFIPTVTPISTQTPQPTEPPQPTQTPVDTTTPDYIIGEWLVNPQVVWQEGVEAMAENQGGQFGPGSNKSYNEQEKVFTFTDSESIIWTPLNTHLDEWDGVESHGNQAILVKWQAFPPSGMTFTFMGSSKEFSIQFHGPCHLARIEGIEEFNGNIKMEEGVWFYTLMAIDKNGQFRSVIWRVDDTENRSSYSGEFGSDYANDSWKFILGSTAPMKLNLDEYKVITFDDFAQ